MTQCKVSQKTAGLLWQLNTQAQKGTVSEQNQIKVLKVMKFELCYS